MNNGRIEVSGIETPPILTKFFQKMQKLQAAVSEGKKADFTSLLDDDFCNYISTHVENYEKFKNLELEAKSKKKETLVKLIKYYLKSMQESADNFFKINETSNNIKNSIEQKLEKITESSFFVDVDGTLAYTAHFTDEYAKRLAEAGLDMFPEEPYFCNPLIVKILEQLQSEGNKIVLLTSQTDIASQEVRKSLPKSLKKLQFINRDAFKKYLESMSQFCYPELYADIPNSLKSERYILSQISKIAPWIETIEGLRDVSQRFYEYFGNDIIENNNLYKYYFPVEESKSDSIEYLTAIRKFPSWFAPTDRLEKTFVIDDILEWEESAKKSFGSDKHFPKENLIPYKFNQNSWQGAVLDLIDGISNAYENSTQNPHT